MKSTKAIGKMVIIGIIIVVIVVAGVAAYYLATPPLKLKETLILGTTDSVETCLDPARAYDFFGWNVIQSLGCGLVEYKPGATGSPEDIVGSLAASWDISTDGLEYTFNLRQGVKYDDGTEFNATHVKYTFDRGVDIADENGAFVGIGIGGEGGIIKDISVVSKYVVKFRLNYSYAAFLSLLTGQMCYIVDPSHAPANAVVEYHEGDARGSYPLGLGPYTLKSWTRVAGKDNEMRFEANPNYWGATNGYPKTKNIIIRFYANSAGLALAIKSQELDIAFRQLAPTDINDMKNNANLHVWEGTGAQIQYIVLQEGYSPFNVTNVRKAVAAAINRTTVVQTAFSGAAQKLYSMIPIGMFGHTDAFKSHGDPNYTRTRELLAEVGYNENNKLKFDLWYETSGHYPQSQQIAQVLKSSLEASGVIEVTLKSADWPSMGANRRSGSMQAYIYGWYPDYIDPDDYVYPFVHSSGGTWLFYHYNSTQMDQLVQWARANASATVRNNLYGQIQNLMVEDCPLVPVYQSSAYAVTTTKVKGVYLDITMNWRHWLVYAEE